MDCCNHLFARFRFQDLRTSDSPGQKGVRSTISWGVLSLLGDMCGIRVGAGMAWSIGHRAESRRDFGLRPRETGFAFHGAGILDLGKANVKVLKTE